MKKQADDELTEAIIAHFTLKSAILIRCLSSESEQYFILEDVATRKRQRFENKEMLLDWLRNWV